MGGGGKRNKVMEMKCDNKNIHNMVEWVTTMPMKSHI